MAKHFTTHFTADDDTEVTVTFAVHPPEPEVNVGAVPEITDVEPAAYWGEAEDTLTADELVERAASEAQDAEAERADHLRKLRQEAA